MTRKTLLSGRRVLWGDSLPAGLRCMGGTSKKRKFRAPALKSSSWVLRRSRTALLGSGLKLSRRKSLQSSDENKNIRITRNH